MISFRTGRKYSSYFSVVLILFLLLPVLCIAQGEPLLTTAPINPDFLRYLRDRDLGLVKLHTDEGYALGLMPSPLDLSHLTGEQMLGSHGALGSSLYYDLREQGKLTPVKDQGSCGSCWTFATYGSLESNLLPSEIGDFSENNLKNTHGFDLGPCEGGNPTMSVAYLARWSGPVSESDDPYNPYSSYSPQGLSPRKHLQQAIEVPARANPLDNDNIKGVVMTYGAVATSLYFDDLYYDDSNATYYYGGSNSHNHAVAIVGWDDTISRYDFSPYAPGDGAFVVRNSWGSGWGDAGYFYVSYYDSIASGSMNCVFNGSEPTTNYASMYQYDSLGWTSSLGYGGNTAWFANIFTATSNGELAAASFYTPSLNSSYEMYIYTNVTSGPTSGTLAATKTETIPWTGYHTIPLNEPVPLVTGQKFSIVVKLTTPEYSYPIPIEMPFSDYSSGATASAGQSYLSSNGATWRDITLDYPNTNVCLKGFTIPSTIITTTVTTNPSGLQIRVDGSNYTSPHNFNWEPGSDHTIEALSPQNGTTGTRYVYASWSDGGDQTHSIVVPSSTTTFTATFTTQYSLTTSVNPSGAGSVDPAGTSWYGKDESVAISATGSPPYIFSNWSGGLSGGTNPTSTSMSGPKSVTAHFEVISTPDSPVGPTTGNPGASQVFAAVGSSSNLGHSIQYFFDWADGTDSGWLPVGSYSASKSWSTSDSYAVRVKARCANSVSIESNWSEPLIVTISDVTYTQIVLLAPNGGDVLATGSLSTIQWGSPSQATKFNLSYSIDNGKTWKQIASNLRELSYNWQIPMLAGNKTKCLVKVVGFNENGLKVGMDKSDGIFKIEVVRVNSPNGGESVTPGRTCTVTWATNSTKKQVQKANLFYTIDGGATWKQAGSAAGNPGTIDWSVPQVTKPKYSCRIKVVLLDSSGKSLGNDPSDNFFAIE